MVIVKKKKKKNLPLVQFYLDSLNNNLRPNITVRHKEQIEKPVLTQAQMTRQAALSPQLMLRLMLMLR